MNVFIQWKVKSVAVNLMLEKNTSVNKDILNSVFDRNILFWYKNITIAVNSSVVNNQYSKVSMLDVRKYFLLLPQVPIMIINSYEIKQHK